MPTNPRRKSDSARRANQVIRSRTVLVMILLGIGAAVTLVVLGVRALIENIRRKRLEEDLFGEEYFPDDDNEDNGEELPF